jgi:hypothetical protein
MYIVGFEVLTVVITKMAVFWVEAPCRLVSAYRHRPVMEAVRACETLVNSYQSTRRYNPEDSHVKCI